jgi:hypothetical protein
VRPMTVRQWGLIAVVLYPLSDAVSDGGRVHHSPIVWSVTVTASCMQLSKQLQFSISGRVYISYRPQSVQALENRMCLKLGRLLTLFDVSVPTCSRTQSGFCGSIAGGSWEFFSSPPLCPERLWGPPNLLSNGYQGLFSRG